MRILNSKWLALLLIVVAGSLVFSLVDLNARRAGFQTSVSDMKQKIKEAERSKAYLERSAAYFESPEFLEKQARAKLNYKSADESVVFVFRDPNSKSSSDALAQLKNTANYLKWWYYVLGY